MPTPKIPRYELFEPPLGEGSYGVVYRARFNGLDERAVKVFKRGLLDFDVLRRELEKLAKAKHGGIVVLYDFDLTGETPYYAMGLHAQKDEQGKWKGRTLEGICGKVEVKEALPLLRQVAEAGAFLHKGLAEPIIHCDLKPSNVLLTGEDPPRVQLCDFGQSRSSAVKTLELSGTPFYASPEQLRRPGDSGGGKGFRWDVYSFGVLAYKVLTGKLPRLEERAKELREEDTARSIIQEGRHALDAEELARLTESEAVAPWPKELKLGAEEKAVVLKCLEIDPEKRFAHLGEVAEEFKRIEEGRRARLRRNVMVALGCLTVLAFAGLTWAVVKQREAERATDVAEGELYSSGIFSANAEVSAGNYVEPMEILASLPADRRGWEWHYLLGKIGFAPMVVSRENLAILDSLALKGSGLAEKARQMLAGVETMTRLESHGLDYVRGDVGLWLLSGDRGGGGVLVKRQVGGKWVASSRYSTGAYGTATSGWISEDGSVALIASERLSGNYLDVARVLGLSRPPSEQLLYVVPVRNVFSLLDLLGRDYESGTEITIPSWAMEWGAQSPVSAVWRVNYSQAASAADGKEPEEGMARFILQPVGREGMRVSPVDPDEADAAGETAILASLQMPEGRREGFLKWASDGFIPGDYHPEGDKRRELVAVDWSKGLKRALVRAHDGGVAIWDLETMKTVAELASDEEAKAIWRAYAGHVDKGAAFSEDGSTLLVAPLRGDRAAVLNTGEWSTRSEIDGATMKANDWSARPSIGAFWGLTSLGSFAFMAGYDPPAGTTFYGLASSADGRVLEEGSNGLISFGSDAQESVFADLNGFTRTVRLRQAPLGTVLKEFRYDGQMGEKLVLSPPSEVVNRLIVADQLLERSSFKTLLRFPSTARFIAPDWSAVTEFIPNCPDLQKWGDQEPVIQVVDHIIDSGKQESTLAEKVRSLQFSLLSSAERKKAELRWIVENSLDYKVSELIRMVEQFSIQTPLRDLQNIASKARGLEEELSAWLVSLSAPDTASQLSLQVRLIAALATGDPVDRETAEKAQELLNQEDAESDWGSRGDVLKELVRAHALAQKLDVVLEDEPDDRALHLFRDSLAGHYSASSLPETSGLEGDLTMALTLWAARAAATGDTSSAIGWIAAAALFDEELLDARAWGGTPPGSGFIYKALVARRVDDAKIPFWYSCMTPSDQKQLNDLISSIPADFDAHAAAWLLLDSVQGTVPNSLNERMLELLLTDGYDLGNHIPRSISSAEGARAFRKFLINSLNRGQTQVAQRLVECVRSFASEDSARYLPDSSELSDSGKQVLRGLEK